MDSFIGGGSDDTKKKITSALIGIIGGAALFSGAILVYDENKHGAERQALQKAREQVQTTLMMARDFTQAAMKSNTGSDMACVALKSAMGQMIAGHLSYGDIGTTKEKFEMIRDYNGCKFN